jgi:hypothetical protein
MIGVMRLIPCVAVLCMLGSVAVADPSVWDRTYKKGGQNGSFPPCPEAVSDVVIKNGQFSIPWQVTIGKKVTTIGHIVGSVRPSGLAETTVNLDNPLPAAFVRFMNDNTEPVADMPKIELKLKFEALHDGRQFTIRLESEHWSCQTWWQEDRASLQAAAQGGGVNCNSGAYAVALWSNKREFSPGDYTRVGVPGQPIRLYRCVDGCKPGEDPLTQQEVHEVQKWAFVGACTGQDMPAAALPAKGSPKWDGTYGVGRALVGDWRCPRDQEIKQLVIKNGRFTLPWFLSTDQADGNKYEDMQIGHLDGAIADDGKVDLRYVWTVDKLPPEVLEVQKYDAQHATLAYINTLAGTMKFKSNSGKMNPSGQGLEAMLVFDNDENCEYQFLGQGYKPQEFKESDGWRVDCHSYENWKSDGAYNEGDQAMVGDALYRCNESSACKVGSRPGRSSQWERVGRCK